MATTGTYIAKAATQQKEALCTSCSQSLKQKSGGIKCSNCKSVTYCDQECLRKDAKFHDGKICSELKEDYYAQLRKQRSN